MHCGTILPKEWCLLFNRVALCAICTQVWLVINISEDLYLQLLLSPQTLFLCVRSTDVTWSFTVRLTVSWCVQIV